MAPARPAEVQPIRLIDEAHCIRPIAVPVHPHDYQAAAASEAASTRPDAVVHPPKGSRLRDAHNLSIKAAIDGLAVSRLN